MIKKKLIFIIFILILSGPKIFNQEIDTLYYLPDSTSFISEYLIAGEVWGIHTRFLPDDSEAYYKIKELHLLYTTMVLGDSIKTIDFCKDTLKTIVYSLLLNIKLDTGEVYPNWYKIKIPDESPVFKGEIEIPVGMFLLCIPEITAGSGHTIGFFDSSENWGITIDYPIKLIIQKVITGIDNEKTNNLSYSLYQNYPNPFNPTTNFGFRIVNFGLVTLKIYDILGNEVAVLLNEEKQPGEYKVEFNGNYLASGVYYYQLKSGNFIDTKKFVLLK